MDTGVQIALIVGLTTVGTAIITMLSNTIQTFVASKVHRREREEDWKHQEVVAKKVSEAATLLARNTQLVTERSTALLQSNVAIEKKVDVVTNIAVTTHGLVNSRLTEVMQSLLDGLRRELVLMIQAEKSEMELESQRIRISRAEDELTYKAEQDKTGGGNKVTSKP